MRKGIAVVFASACVAVALTSTWLVNQPRLSLDRFLRKVATVEIGKTTLDDWRGQLDRAHLSNVNRKCTDQTCTFSWRGENRLLQKLRLAPRTAVTADVGFKDGVANEIYIFLSILKRTGEGDWVDDKGVVVRHIADTSLPCDPHYKLEVKQRNGVGDSYWATVAMGSCVSPKDRMKAMAINAGCLSKLGGCQTVEQMIRGVFSHP